MSIMKATLVQLPPLIMSSHTLPPVVYQVWKICSLWLGSQGASWAWNAFWIIKSSPTFKWSNLVLILSFLLTYSFLNNLDFFHFSNGESSSIGTICLEMSIIMAFETLFTVQFLWCFTSNPFIMLRVLMRVEVELTLLGEEWHLGLLWGQIKGVVWKDFRPLSCFSTLIDTHH